MRITYTQIQQDLTQILCVIFIFAVFFRHFLTTQFGISVVFHNSSPLNFTTPLKGILTK